MRERGLGNCLLIKHISSKWFYYIWLFIVVVVVAVVALPFVHFCSLTNLTAWAQNFTARSSHFARNPQTVKKRKTEKSQLKKNSKKAAAASASAWNYKTVGRKMLQSWTCWGMLMFMYESTRRRAHTHLGLPKKREHHKQLDWTGLRCTASLSGSSMLQLFGQSCHCIISLCCTRGRVECTPERWCSCAAHGEKGQPGKQMKSAFH